MNVGREVSIQRIHTPTPEAVSLLVEYYETVGVVQRDDAESMRRLLEDPRSAMWLAGYKGEVAGCVVLRAGVPGPGAGECKRLYVRAEHRRRGIADALMEALESFAGETGMRWIYLDTNEAFLASLALYQRRGYKPCARYNENAQATCFFRKQLPALVAV